MRTLIIILIFILNTSCSDENDCCTIVDLQTELEFINNEEEDLLNPITENHFNENDIKVFYLVNNEKKEILRGNLDNPRMFSLSEPSIERDYYTLILSLNDLSDDEIKTTYLQLNESTTDTITHTQTNQTIDKVWYNGKISTEEHTFKIVK